MIPSRIPGANRNLGAPVDWNAERDGECDPLPVLDDGRTFQSTWTPTDSELAILNAGGSVVLTIWGRTHPPVSLTTMLEQT